MDDGKKGVCFVVNCGSAATTGGGWILAFLASALGFLALALTLAVDGSWLIAVAAYGIVAGGTFVALVLFIHSNCCDAIAGGTGFRSDFGVLDRDFSSWVQRGPDRMPVDDGRIFCVSSAKFGALGLSIAEDVAGRGYYVDVCDDLHEALSSISLAPHRWSLLIVDIDECERHSDFSDVVDSLMCFRDDVPGTPVMIISSKFGSDDFSLEQLEVADFSIRLPATTTRILEAVSIACSNNKSWRVRVTGRMSNYLSDNDSIL